MNAEVKTGHDGSTGFCVGWSNFSSSELPIMNFGDGESQTVAFSPALLFLRFRQSWACPGSTRRK
jgi:hypothetical protein